MQKKFLRLKACKSFYKMVTTFIILLFFGYFDLKCSIKLVIAILDYAIFKILFQKLELK